MVGVFLFVVGLIFIVVGPAAEKSGPRLPSEKSAAAKAAAMLAAAASLPAERTLLVG